MCKKISFTDASNEYNVMHTFRPKELCLTFLTGIEVRCDVKKIINNPQVLAQREPKHDG